MMLLGMFLSLSVHLFAQLHTPQDLGVIKPFAALNKSSLQMASVNPNLIIFETENHYLLKSPLTNFESYGYFYIQLPEDSKFDQWLQSNVPVVFRNNEFVVVQINNENTLLEVSKKIHDAGDFCGMIQRLSATPISMAIKDAVPYSRAKDPAVEAVLPFVEVERILATITTMQSWKTRYEGTAEGQQTSAKLKQIYQDLLSVDRTDVTIEEVAHDETQQKSLVVRILGQNQPEEIVILGSHLDSINSNNNNDAPGADDNASGTATNIEVFRVLMANNIKPKKTIEFHAYAAEEIGLIGSAEIAVDYKKQNKKVSAMVQFDMNGYTDSSAAINFVTNGTNSTLTKDLNKLVADYLTIPAKNGYLMMGTSDHASWAKRGFAVAFPTEDPWNYNHSIHTKNDTMAKINSPTQIHEFGKLGVAYLMHFAGYVPTAQ